MLAERLLQAGEVAVMQMIRMADGAQAFLRFRQILGIHIEADEQPGWADAFEKFGAVAGPADGAIDDYHAGLRVENAQDFIEQDGAMLAVGGAALVLMASHGLHVFLANARIGLV